MRRRLGDLGVIATTHWAIVRPSRTAGKAWYHVSRVVQETESGQYFEMYWHPGIELRGPSKAVIRAEAADLYGLQLLDDVLWPDESKRMNALCAM